MLISTNNFKSNDFFLNIVHTCSNLFFFSLKFTTHIKFKTKFSKDFSSVIRYNSQHFGLTYQSKNVLILAIEFESKKSTKVNQIIDNQLFNQKKVDQATDNQFDLNYQDFMSNSIMHWQPILNQFKE